MKKFIISVMIAAISATSAMALDHPNNNDTGGVLERPNLELVRDQFTPEEFDYAKNYNDDLFNKLVGPGSSNLIGFLVAQHKVDWIETVLDRVNVQDNFNIIQQKPNVYTLNTTNAHTTIFKKTSNDATAHIDHEFSSKSGIYTMRCQDNEYGIICGVNPGWLAEMDLHTDRTQQQMLNQIKKEVQSDHEGRPVVLVNQT